MKKIILGSLAAAALTVPAIANAQTATAPAAAPATAMTAPTTTTAPAAAAAPIELKDGSWAKVGTDGSVMVSSDGGKTWVPAPDGAWVSKDGMTTINVKGGKKV